MSRFLLVVLFAVLGGGAHAQSEATKADFWACVGRVAAPDTAACTRFLDAADGSIQYRSKVFFHLGMSHLRLVEADMDADDDLSAADKAHLDAAESHFSESIELMPNIGVTYEVRGEVRKRTGHPLGAAADLKKALDLKAAEADALAQLAKSKQDHCFENGTAFKVGSSFCAGKYQTKECHAGGTTSSPAAWHTKHNPDQECIGPPPP
jgi:hypothetical protein